MPRYRVVQLSESNLGNYRAVHVLWEGDSLLNVLSLFGNPQCQDDHSISAAHRGGYDVLSSRTYQDGRITAVCVWQEQISDGRWKEIADPRVSHDDSRA
jgi:hypothetical protein